jgi:hypothetical protein
MRDSGRICAPESRKHLPSKQTVLIELSMLCIPSSNRNHKILVHLDLKFYLDLGAVILIPAETSHIRFTMNCLIKNYEKL